jgi:hypothetical protein
MSLTAHESLFRFEVAVKVWRQLGADALEVVESVWRELKHQAIVATTPAHPATVRVGQLEVAYEVSPERRMVTLLDVQRVR